MARGFVAHEQQQPTPSADDVMAWRRATLEDGREGYMAFRAIRDGDDIVDWLVVDANEITRDTWRDAVSEIIGSRASKLNAVADNSAIFRVFAEALATGRVQELELELLLPNGASGYRRFVVTPLDADTVSSMTRDVAREHYLQAALERERKALDPHAAHEQAAATEIGPDARFACRSASVLLVGSAVAAMTNSLITDLHGVNTSALFLTGVVATVLALVVLVLPWERHYTVVTTGLSFSVIALLVVSDAINHYSLSEAATAVYPVFFILLVAWAGMTGRRGTASLIALVSLPALARILYSGGHASVAWQCMIVTIPVAALLGEVLSWTTHRARALTNLEMRRRLHDPLTGLANRTLLSIRIEHALTRVRRYHNALAVLYLDVDNFKHVNDSLGHNAGDDLLLDVAARLRSLVRESDTVARMGGDEFVVLCEDVSDQTALAKIAERYLRAFERPFTLGTVETSVSLSIGIAFSPNGIETAEALVQNADIALYRAKQAGKARFEVFGEELRHEIAARRDLEHSLAQAATNNQLEVHYQPIIATEQGTIIGFEALVRWNRPGYGLVLPHEFIPIAEDTGLILEVGEWVLTEACREAMRWPKQLGISVNLSAQQISCGDIVATVTRALRRTGLPARLLTLELTESMLIDNPVAAATRLNALRDLGVNLALDDFGTGYSSLTYLRSFPINVVKIDRRFVRAIGSERQDTAIVAAVIGLARNLDLQVVAEGVETEEQLATLIHLNCDHVQGFLFSAARPPDEIPALLTRTGSWLTPASTRP